MQAYRAWLETDHQFLFYVNNDVLVPDGVIDALARAMTKEGEPSLEDIMMDLQVTLDTAGLFGAPMNFTQHSGVLLPRHRAFASVQLVVVTATELFLRRA